MSRKLLNMPLFLLALAAISIRLLFCAWRIGLGRTYEYYHLEYILTAKRFLIHHTFLCPFILDDTSAGPSAILPPIYVLMVSGFYALFGAGSFTSTLILQICNAVAIGVVTVIVYQITRRMANTYAAWIAAVIVTTNPILFGFTHLIWETYIYAMVITITYGGLTLCQQSPPAGCDGFGLACGWAWLPC